MTSFQVRSREMMERSSKVSFSEFYPFSIYKDRKTKVFL